MQLQYGGRRERLSLDTSNKAEGAVRARDLYRNVVSLGWDAALSTYHPERSKSNVTIGQFFDELKEKADLTPKTLAGYMIAFRMIVADSFA
jgi:hypothetical protein